MFLEDYTTLTLYIFVNQAIGIYRPSLWKNGYHANTAYTLQRHPYFKLEMESIFISDEGRVNYFHKKANQDFYAWRWWYHRVRYNAKKNARKDEPIHLFGWYNSLLIISCYSHYRGCTKPALTAWTVILFEITKQQFQIHWVGITEET